MGRNDKSLHMAIPNHREKLDVQLNRGRTNTWALIYKARHLAPQVH